MGGEGLSRVAPVCVKPICWLSPKVEPPLPCAVYPFGSTSPCQHIQRLVVQLESWLLNQGQARNSSVSSEVRQEKSAERAAEWQGRALGSTRAVFRDLKEVTVVPGALFLPASAAGKASE